MRWCVIIRSGKWCDDLYVAGLILNTALHRDQFIPVKRQVTAEGWSSWSEKEGVTYVRPPEPILASMVAVRLHLEDNNEFNGPLQVIPGSHIQHSESKTRVKCFVRKGGALVLRPLLLHASSKLTQGARRVLHFLYGPNNLPNGVKWKYTIK